MGCWSLCSSDIGERLSPIEGATPDDVDSGLVLGAGVMYRLYG